jgi:hypothetical protein
MKMEMNLAIPKIAVLDTSTLGRVSRDYWSSEGVLRDKARRFLTDLTNRGIYIAFTLTHICELFRHGDQEVVQNRLKFLRSIQLIAWMRPFNHTRFVGDMPDLLTRELHAVIHCSSHGWREIIQKVREALWKTGSGSDFFIQNDPFWSYIREKASSLLEHQEYVASVARADATGNHDITISALLKSPQRPKESWAEYARGLAERTRKQLDQHGDKRLTETGSIADRCAIDTLDRMRDLEKAGGNPVLRELEFRGVPLELIDSKTTVADAGELAIYAERLKQCAGKLNPPQEVSIVDVPIDRLPSYFLERKLASHQGNAERVSGSDLGDCLIAPLIFYSDGVEVDKRTFHYLDIIRGAHPALAELMMPHFRSTDYSEIPKRF